MDIKLQKATLSFNNGLSFAVYSNLGDSLNDAAQAWAKWTNIRDVDSFCNYINSKRLNGLGAFIAISEERWLEMQAEINNEKQ